METGRTGMSLESSGVASTWSAADIETGCTVTEGSHISMPTDKREAPNEVDAGKRAQLLIRGEETPSEMSSPSFSVTSSSSPASQHCKVSSPAAVSSSTPRAVVCAVSHPAPAGPSTTDCGNPAPALPPGAPDVHDNETSSPSCPEDSCASSPSSSGKVPGKTPPALAVVIIGMAGSGKSTFVGGLQRCLMGRGKRVYTINLDPAVVTLDYDANIDIRDTVDYKKVMQHYHLGPNGAILTSLNLFATKFGDVLSLLEKRKTTHDIILLDTPGQIEVFTWSASGTIILESLSATVPTCVCYILDTPRCTRPITLMSNMLYACSVLYKAKLPFIGCFNKIDVTSHALCQEWMTDYDAFQEALLTDESYLASLSRSSALMLVEFYRVIQTVGVSSTTGLGMSDMLRQLERCREEYETEFLPFLEQQKKTKEARAQESVQQQLDRFKRDYDPAAGAASVAAGLAAASSSSSQSKHRKEAPRGDIGKTATRSSALGGETEKKTEQVKSTESGGVGAGAAPVNSPQLVQGGA
ncbi:atp binding [Cystoisospora suis]|uniref:GPN-loop GTPase 1 n=1 Tax=Cystoisospora suis TaxID=483139 RepID=A0A2C6L0U0_9APIC|nr:atp binding [Cystoisospora suis]